MNLPRFHVAAAAPGARVPLPEHEAHHAREVLRLRAGAPVRVFDGAGNEFEGWLESVSRQGVTARLASAVAPLAESPLRLVLALPPLKGDRMELVIQKATELGVAEIWPVVTARTDAAARPALRGTRQERWEKVASGAAAQCGRAVVPHVAATIDLAALISGSFDGPRLVFLERTPTRAIPTLTPPPPRALALVGPAGGWEDHELSRLLQAGFHAAALGPRLLRSETAAIAAVAALQWLWGDLADSPREAQE